MPYNIELMSIGEDVYPLLERAKDALNGIQGEFRFSLTSAAQRQAAIAFQRSKYTTAEIWNFLKDHKARFGGHRPYIIGFVTKPLQSSELRNIFGSHEAADGLAVVTTNNAGQYVKEETRYCCYYLVRYSLSFINPKLRAHNDPELTNCYFHQKIYKPEIRVSMDAGYICDRCRQQLENPASGGHKISDDENEALRKMLEFVSGDYPRAVVMKGGGVKGLAFAGALLELEKYFWFNQHVGASAGAIAAVLLAAGYTPSELKDLLLTKDFRDFMDAPFWKVPINLIIKQGCYPGETFREWLADLLTKKIHKLAEVPMSALNGALIYAARRGQGTLRFASAGQRRETAAAFAVRCSMSIPIFFVPQQIDGRRVFDGGLRNNFPLARFLEDCPGSPFIALYLGKPDNTNRRWFGSELLDIFIDGEERQTVDENIRNVVVIDTTPVGTVDFGMVDIEKDFLLKAGRSAALKFLLNQKLDDGPSRSEVDGALAIAEASRSAVVRLRAVRRWKKLGQFVLIVAIVVATYWILLKLPG